MSEFVDYTLLAEGSPEGLGPVLGAVREFQNRNAGVSGNGNCDFRTEPSFGADGKTMRWSFYTTGDCEGFWKTLRKAVAAHPGLAVTVHSESTDGGSWGETRRFSGSRSRILAHRDAATGIDAAMAMIRLDRKPTPEDAAIVLDRILLAESDGWDGDDVAWLGTAMVCAIGLSLAADRKPGLLDGLELTKAEGVLLGMIRDMPDMDVGDGEDLAAVERLLEAVRKAG
jgi:hypothetical protein